MMRWPPASTRRPGWLRSAEGTLAEVPRNVRSNIVGPVLSVVRQTAMARACKRTISRTNVASRARRTCALSRLPGSRPRPRSDTSDVSLLRSARRDGRRRARGATPAGVSASGPKASSNRSTKTVCPFRIFRRASALPNQAARSISGKVPRRPERGGHSISKVLLRMSAGSQSPSMAHARTTLPPGCRASPSGRKSPSGSYPVSSANSRRAAGPDHRNH